MWKDWESADAVDWPGFTAALSAAKASTSAPFVVVEGFLITAPLDQGGAVIATEPALIYMGNGYG